MIQISLASNPSRIFSSVWESIRSAAAFDVTVDGGDTFRIDPTSFCPALFRDRRVRGLPIHGVHMILGFIDPFPLKLSAKYTLVFNKLWAQLDHLPLPFGLLIWKLPDSEWVSEWGHKKGCGHGHLLHLPHDNDRHYINSAYLIVWLLGSFMIMSVWVPQKM